ncbi:MAG: glycine--tRNA ligase subunit beta [Ardenticatenaceae bacterium]|nr:glycine--tRNA ligase subunit beta [Ardenticatenaceae bacterium]
MNSAIKQLETMVPELLANLRLTYDRLEVFGTPRRLAVLVHQLEGRQQDLEIEVRPACRSCL